MAVAVRGSATSITNTTTWSCSMPTGGGAPVAGDLIIVVVALDASATSNLGTTPTGYAQKRATAISSPDGQVMGVYTKTAVGGEGNISVTIGGGLTRTSAVCIAVISGWNAYSDVAISTNTTNNASPVTITVPTITPGASNSMWLAIAALDVTNAAGGTNPYTNGGSGFTTVCNLGSAGSPDASLYIGSKTISAASGTQAVTISHPGGWLAVSLALTPSGGTTVNLTGVAGTGSEGTFLPKLKGLASGVAGTAAEGSVLPKLKAPVSGVSATAAEGTALARIKGLPIGQSATGALGAFGLSALVGMSGVAGTGATGSILARILGLPAGQQATAAEGSLAPETALTLAGEVATGTAGNLLPRIAAPLSGAQATAGIGSLGPSTIAFLIGVFATGSEGVLSPPGTIVVNLTGVQASGVEGSFGVRRTAALTGVQGSGAEGSFLARLRAGLSGVVAASATGAFRVAFAPTLHGVQASGDVGSFVFILPPPKLVSITFTNVGMAATTVITNIGIQASTAIVNSGIACPSITFTDLD